jgi:hypothetical protein
MPDTYSINITPSAVTITRAADGSTIFSTDYNYLTYDPAGTIIWPVSPTMRSSGGNLTWQLNGQQIIIHNLYYVAGVPVTFDTYIMPMRALNPSITSDSFVDYLQSNTENPASSV